MSRESHSVPSSEVDLTSEWLRSALAGRFPDASPQLAGTEQIGQGYGLSSVLVRCRLAGSGGPGSVVVKLWATDGPSGFREVLFYTLFAENLGIRVPVCYHGSIDEDRRRGVLVLEDLECAVQGDCLSLLDGRGAVVLAREIAALHANWWERSELGATQWLPSVRVVQRESEWFLSRRELFLSRLGDRIESRISWLLERVEQAQTRANERLAGAAMTLLHADLHLDNVVFDGGTEFPVLLDWARVAQGPAALDLAALLFAMAPIAQFEHVLSVYLGEMHRRGIGNCDERSLRHQLGGALLRKFISATCGVAHWQPASERERKMIEVDLQRVVEAIEMWRRQDPDLFQL
jgi:thiamine kinase-like enzyme